MKLPEGWPTEEMSWAGHFVLTNQLNQASIDVKPVFKAMFAAAPSLQVQESKIEKYEPVAFRVRHKGEKDWKAASYFPITTNKLLNSFQHDSYYDVELLYTCPDDKLRKAAEKFFTLYDDPMPDTDSVLQAVENLRAALEG